MVATAKKTDIYVLRGQPSSDDYTSRRLVASEVQLIGRSDSWRLFKPGKCSLTFDLTTGRFNSELLIPDRCYRFDFEGQIEYYGLVSYERRNGELTLHMELL